MFEPKVSIIIPVYNGSNYMREAIDSALTQTYKNIEIIVVNDGSSDNTEEIALSYGDQIRYFSKENGGQSSALNYGIEKMTGEYFSWLSHDDVYFPDKIEKQIAFLNKLDHRDNVFLYSNFEIIDKESKHLRFFTITDSDPRHFIYNFLFNITINGCTTLVRKQHLYELGLFNTSRPHTSDVELFLKLALKYSAIHVPEFLIKSRSHPNQATLKHFKYHVFESNLFLCDSLALVPAVILVEGSTIKDPSYIYKTIAYNYARKGFKKASLRGLDLYRKYNTSVLLYCFHLFSCILLYNYRILRRKFVSLVKNK
jgi:glycosyltransferase involved in cell wall biosynthesis